MIMENPNKILLSKVNQADAWFPAIKTQPIWAKPTTETQSVSSLEGDTISSPGDAICRGIEGELWTQSLDRLKSQYQQTDDPPEEGFHKYNPIASQSGVLAAQINHEFSVETAFGLLSGLSGDFLLKSASDADCEFPTDIWIVAAAIFDATYQRS